MTSMSVLIILVSRFVLSIWVNWGIPGYLDKGGGGGSSTSTVWQEYGPGTVRVTGESRDTWTKGGGGVPVLQLYGRSTVLGLSG